MLKKVPVTFEEALINFEALEQELELPSWVLNEVYVWKLLRFSMFSQYQRSSGLTETAHPEAERLKREEEKSQTKAQIILDFQKLLLLRNPFLIRRKNIERIIIPSSRKRTVEGHLLDPLSYSVWSKDYKSSSMVLDKTSVLNPQPLPGTPSFRTLLYLACVQRKRKFTHITFGAEDMERIRRIESFFEGLPNVNMVKPEIECRVRDVALFFLALKSVLHALFRRVNPKMLYVVEGYGNEAAIAAAQELGIVTVEFQHGALGRGHVAYDFHNWQFVPYFSDYLLAFGEAWFEDVSLPQRCVLKFVGTPFVEKEAVVAMAKIKRKERQLLVLSQGPVSKDLLFHVAKFVVARPDWKVLIRPHPSESPEALRKILEKNLRGKCERVRIEKKRSLVEHAAESTVVFGVSSTALVEAMLAGCKGVVLDLQNSTKYFSHLVENGNAVFVESGEQLATLIDQLPKGSARDYFAEPVEDVVSLIEKDTAFVGDFLG